MKTQRILILLVFFLASACQTSSTPPPADVNPGLSQEFTLAPGGSAAVAGTDLVVTFHSIVADERCPSGVDCAASGPVAVSLSVQQGDGAPTDFTLQTFTDEEGRSPNVQFEGVTNHAEVGGYKIQLTSVTPYPADSVLKIDPAAYRVTLLVTNP